MYATTSTGYRAHVTVSKDVRVIQTININNTYCRLIQTITTTQRQWLGLNYTDASGLLDASETSKLGNVTRQYLGSAKIQVGSGGTALWATVDGCWGTKVQSQLSRMGDNNHYMVVKTITEMTVSNDGGTLTLL